MRHTLPLGTIVVSPLARQELARVGQDPMAYVCRHARGDWGSALSVYEMAANDNSFENGGGILSAYYYTRWEVLWVITQGDRMTTMVLLPQEY